MEFRVDDRVKYSQAYLYNWGDFFPSARSCRGVVVNLNANAHDGLFSDGCVLVRWDDKPECPRWVNPNNLTLAEPEILQGVPLDPPVKCERWFSAETKRFLEWHHYDTYDCIGAGTPGLGCWHHPMQAGVVQAYAGEFLYADLSSPDEIESAVAGLYAVEEGVG